MDKNHFSARRLRAPGEPISKSVSLWWEPTSEGVPSPTQLATQELQKANSPERKSTVMEYGSDEEKEKELKKPRDLPNLFSGHRGTKPKAEVPPPAGVPHHEFQMATTRR